MEPKKWPTAKILGVKVDFPSLKQAGEWVEEQVNYNKVVQITTPNPEQVVLAQDDAEFRAVLNHAGLSICDGFGLYLAAKLGVAPDRFSKSLPRDTEDQSVHKGFGPNANIFSKDHFAPSLVKTHKIGQTPVFHRLSGVDLMLTLCRQAVEKGWRVMLVGGRGNIAALATNQIQSLKGRIPSECKAQNYNVKFKIIGLSGSRDIKHETEEERKEVINKINDFKPQLLFVAYGAPYQEKWLARNLPYLKVNVAMGVGGAFDYLAGKTRRAPQWMRNLGLEWLWRLCHEPWRLKRQLNLLKFMWLVWREARLKGKGQYRPQ